VFNNIFKTIIELSAEVLEGISSLIHYIQVVAYFLGTLYLSTRYEQWYSPTNSQFIPRICTMIFTGFTHVYPQGIHRGKGSCTLMHCN